MLFLVLLLLLVFLLIRYCRRNYGVLEKTGAPVIAPNFIFGSGPFFMHKYSSRELDIERAQRYGKVWAAYNMGTPWIYVADADVIRQITIKDFDHFPEHCPFFMVYEQKYRHMEIAFQHEWKELRKSATPMFTSNKMKMLINLMTPTIDNLIQYMDKEIGNKGSVVTDVKPVLQYTSLDIIARCALGTEINSFQDPNNHLLTLVKKFFVELTIGDAVSATFLNLLMEFPILAKLMGMGVDNTSAEVWRLVRKAQEQRVKSPMRGQVGDVIDRILEVQESLKKGDMKAVTDEQITTLGNSFLVNGFDTIATAMASLIYTLSKHPEIQQQVIDEVDEKLDEFDGRVDYDSVADMPLTEACIMENLRINPPVFRFDRFCTKDWSYKHLKIPKGVYIGLAYNVLHLDPDYWPEPELYKPERFFKENRENIVPGAFQGFGMGPRSCIGERFAMVQMKITLVRLFQKFRFVHTDKTKMQLKPGELFLNTFDEMVVRVERRK